MARLVIEKPRANVPRLEFGKAKREKAELEKSKSRAEKLFEFHEENEEDRVSFGSKSHRLMFPLYMPDNEFGQKMMAKGRELPDVGPGRYDNEDKSNLLHCVEARVETTKGTVMGGRTADRFQKDKRDILFTPAPSAYIGPSAWSAKKNYRPFNNGASVETRFPGKLTEARLVPPPCKYEHDVARGRRPMQHYSFGGRKILYADEVTDPPGPPPIRKEDRVISRRQRELERERREAGDTEPALKVQEMPVSPGAGMEPQFIRSRYTYMPDSEEKYGKAYLDAFYQKFHRHPDPRRPLIEGIEGRHMVHKKAYLSRYFDDEPPSAGRARSLK